MRTWKDSYEFSEEKQKDIAMWKHIQDKILKYVNTNILWVKSEDYTSTKLKYFVCFLPAKSEDFFYLLAEGRGPMVMYLL